MSQNLPCRHWASRSRALLPHPQWDFPGSSGCLFFSLHNAAGPPSLHDGGPGVDLQQGFCWRRLLRGRRQQGGVAKVAQLGHGLVRFDAGFEGAELDAGFGVGFYALGF